MGFPQMLPNTQGYPAPIVLEEAYRLWKPDPADFIFRQIMPDKLYATPSINYDILGSPFGRLAEGNMDSKPQAVGPRKRQTVSLFPYYRDRLEVLRPSDAVNQHALGMLNVISPMEIAMQMAESIAIATQVEFEFNRVQALLGSITPTLFGATGATYTYPVQTPAAPTVLWANPNSNPIADILGWVIALRGIASKPKLYCNLTVMGYLAQNAAIVNLAKQSVYATEVGPGSSGDTVSARGVASLLQSFTGVEGIILYDKGFRNMDGSGNYTYQTFLPDNRVLLIGEPPDGQSLGALGLCPTINNGGYNNPMPGDFLKVVDKSQSEINGAYEIYGGASFCPELHFPDAVIVGAIG